MIRFVIVEDDQNYTKRIKDIINNEKYKTYLEVKTYDFKGYSEDLLNIINNHDIRTVYILDIELENSKSGIEIASLIRENDWDSEIIFITNHEKMFETAHRNVYNVFDFIEKYHDLEQRLTEDIKLILSKHNDKKMFSYKGRNVDLHLYLQSIKYIYRDKEDRKVIIVTESSKYAVSLGVKEILELLDSRFKVVHRSCIVNTDLVSSYDWNNSKIIMKDGSEVEYLSKKFKKELT